MSRRMYFILLSTGLNAFLLFILANTTPMVFAHEVLSTSRPSIHKVSNRYHTSVTPFTVDTSVRCSPSFIGQGWDQTGNGPGSSGCGGQAWEITTPTTSRVSYDMGTIDGPASYTLRAFITNHANAPMNYDIFADNTLVTTCFFNQATAITWTTICQFSLPGGSVNHELFIDERSGAVHSFVMSSSAIQI